MAVQRIQANALGVDPLLPISVRYADGGRRDKFALFGFRVIDRLRLTIVSQLLRVRGPIVRDARPAKGGSGRCCRRKSYTRRSFPPFAQRELPLPPVT